MSHLGDDELKEYHEIRKKLIKFESEQKKKRAQRKKETKKEQKELDKLFDNVEYALKETYEELKKEDDAIKKLKEE